jgi:hypothetical protein
MRDSLHARGKRNQQQQNFIQGVGLVCRQTPHRTVGPERVRDVSFAHQKKDKETKGIMLPKRMKWKL